jgi:HAMP domain-containing protein
MASDLHPQTEQSATSLVSGIIEDFEQLVKQQMELTRQEIAIDLQRARDATLNLAVGAGVIFLAAVSLFFALVHLIHWATGPAGMDPAWLPLWACYGIIGFVLAVIGAILLSVAAVKLRAINPLHNPAANALKENVQWATHPTK